MSNISIILITWILTLQLTFNKDSKRKMTESRTVDSDVSFHLWKKNKIIIWMSIEKSLLISYEEENKQNNLLN